jgi:hypothetical protein
LILLFILLSEQFLFFCYLLHVISGCKTPENLGHAVIDLKLQEQEEENRILSEQLNKMIIEEEAMKRQMCDLHIRLQTAENEVAALKETNLELQRKVCTFINASLVIILNCINNS